MKTVWNQLKPSYQNKIRQSTYTYNSAKRLKYRLMSAHGWYDLSMRDVQGVLTYTDKYGVTTVVGITSFGRYNPYNKACVSGIPQMYARVTSALDWITKTMQTEVEQCSLYKIVL